MTRRTETTVRVRYYETDRMGIVHHSNYIRWFEIGRTDWLRKMGASYRKVEEAGFYLPVLEVTCQYKKSALYDDELVIKTELAQYNGIRLTFRYDVYRQDELLVSGTTTHCWTTNQLKPVNLKKAWPEMHDIIARQSQA